MGRRKGVIILALQEKVPSDLQMLICNSSRHSRWVIAPLSLCLSWISCIPQIDALASDPH